MIGWIIRITLVLLWFILLLLRVGVQLEYGQSGFFVRIRVAAWYIQVHPARRRREGAQAEERESESPQAEPPQDGEPKKKGGILRFVLDFLPPILRTLRQLCGVIRVDKLDMVLTAGADDPGDAALQYGRANALLGSLWHPIVDTCHVVDGRARVDVDFNAKQPAIYILSDLTLRFGQLLVLTIVFLYRLIAYHRQKTNNVDPEQERRLYQ